ncbi:MAG: S1 RNA-binding domain-containing protein [Actinobacteria bacterium]|nr:S1 RNA-binding domain-containing protein [Actinomycetota bacterium]
MSLPPTHVVVDGSNIATEGRSTPSLRQLDEGVRAFLDQYPHDICTVVVDATFEHRIDASERELFEEAHENGEVITPPAGTIGRGDKFLLEIADRSGATVFSNDSFQEFHGEYTWLFNNGRLIGGKAVPEVGWVFAFRSPVRGPRSRQAVKAARDPERGSSARASSSRAAEPRKSRVPTPKGPPPTPKGPPPIPKGPPPTPKGPPPTPKGPPPTAGPRREPGPATENGAGTSRGTRAAGAAGAQRRRGGNVPPRPVVPVNAPMPFVQFIAAHPVGSTVDGEVVEFSSHGAYVMVGEARCYVPTKRMGDPAPRGPRDVLDMGEVRTFVVQALDAPRRGIDLALPGFEQIDAAMLAGISEEDGEEPTRTGAESEPVPRETTATRRTPARRTPAGRAPATGAMGATRVTDAATVVLGDGAEEVIEVAEKTPSVKKATAGKAAAKKAAPAAKKAATKKVPATKKAAPAAKKATAKKAATKKAAPAAKKAATKKAAPAAKKATAKKAAAKKVPAKTSVAESAAAPDATEVPD